MVNSFFNAGSYNCKTFCHINNIEGYSICTTIQARNFILPQTLLSSQNMCSKGFFSGVGITLSVIVGILIVQFIPTDIISIANLVPSQLLRFKFQNFANTTQTKSQIEILKHTIEHFPSENGLPATLKAVSSGLRDTSRFLKRTSFRNEIEELINDMQTTEDKFYELYQTVSSDAANMYGKLGNIVSCIHRLIDYTRKGNLK